MYRQGTLLLVTWYRHIAHKQIRDLTSSSCQGERSHLPVGSGGGFGMLPRRRKHAPRGFF